jgi:two-component system, NtrC family, C4-dicarboxylate transport sensor histidine kinase DctB
MLTVALGLAAHTFSTGYYLKDGASRAQATLRLTIQSLEGRLRRYEALPVLLADDEIIASLAANPNDGNLQGRANVWLKQENLAVEASDIYVMTLDGKTVAASNFDRPESFVGQSFEYRPYFTQAAVGGKGRFFALGTTSGVRGYYFAAPIRNDSGAILGVIALKIGLDEIEAEWRAQEYRLLVSDPEGIIFLSTDPAWLYRGLLPLTAERIAKTSASRRYADADLSELPHTPSEEHGIALIALSGDDGQPHEYLMSKQMMPLAGWTVHVLLDTGYVRGQARLATVALLLLMGVATSLWLMVRQRRIQLAERIALQEQAKLDLERRVAERTADLERVNHQIETEITERRATEQELRRTQDDLVQAGKLAALGQMSAALSHEINQPLAAARNYADSAAILIDRGESAKARENVTQIVSLIDRMATIAKHLRNVARKPDAPLQAIDLRAAVQEAIALSQSRLNTAHVNLNVGMPDMLPLVQGGPVRLQQVLSNILSNAADAVEGREDRRIAVSAHEFDGKVLLAIRDHGPGVPSAIVDRIFDPFFTTKRVGSGLGLGLSISYNIMKDFGGDLRVTNEADGGATFTLVLPRASTKRLAAE